MAHEQQTRERYVPASCQHFTKFCPDRLIPDVLYYTCNTEVVFSLLFSGGVDGLLFPCALRVSPTNYGHVEQSYEQSTLIVT